MNNHADRRISRTGAEGLARVSVLVMGSPEMARVIKHLFVSRPDFEVVGSVKDVKGLAPQADRLLPELIVAGVNPVSTEVGAAVRAIKRASPLSKLILLCPIGDLAPSALRFGADAFLQSENVVDQLLPAAAALSARSREIARTAAL